MPSSDADRALDRRGFLASAGLGVAAMTLGNSADALAAGATSEAKDVAALMAGNARFAAGKPRCTPATGRRAALALKQSPFAAILGCADSRVPIEIVFDHEPGDIFGVRVAGNTADPAALGSLEFAVAVLKSRIVMVLGHSKCGAVTAAVNYVKDGATVPGHMMDFVKPIVPAAKASKGAHGDWTANAVAENVRETMRGLTARSSILKEAHAKGEIEIVGGVYDLATGKVTLLH